MLTQKTVNVIYKTFIPQSWVQSSSLPNKIHLSTFHLKLPLC